MGNFPLFNLDAGKAQGYLKKNSQKSDHVTRCNKD
jgi:hypothetical protein